MHIARSLLVVPLLLATACGGAEKAGQEVPVAAPAPEPQPEEEAPPAAATLSADNAEEALRRTAPLAEALTAAGAEVFSTGIGACWEGENLCLQVEAKTGADEAGIRELATRALETAGFTGKVEVRLTDENPRQRQGAE